MSEFRHIGKVRRRQDGRAIVTGKALYCDDLPIKNCKYAKVLHSPYPHAEIVSIDTSEAEKLPGVIGVMTYKNAPAWKTGVPAHRPVMSQHLRFVGDPVAAVAAETPQIAEEALELIKVEYKQLTPVYDVEDAIKDGAPEVYRAEDNIESKGYHYDHNCLPPGSWFEGDDPPFYKIQEGDVAKGLAESDVVVEGKVAYTWTFPGAPESPFVAAGWEDEGHVNVWASSQGPNMVCRPLAFTIGAHINVTTPNVGGSYGNKDALGYITMLTVALAKVTGCTVKFALTKEEHLLFYERRLDNKFIGKIGITKDGRIKALQGDWLVGTGAGSELTQGQVAEGLGETHIALNKCPNWDLVSKVVCSNKIPVGIARGFGGQELKACVLHLLNRALKQIDMDPVTFYKKNFCQAGDQYYWRTGHKYSNPVINYDKCFDVAAEKFHWFDRWKGWGVPSRVEGNKAYGVGFSLHSSGDPQSDETFAYVRLENDQVMVHCAVSQFGNGQRLALAKIAAEILNVPLENVTINSSDTRTDPADFGAAGSRETITAGGAVGSAAKAARQKLLEEAAEKLGCQPEDLDTKDMMVFRKDDPSVCVPWIAICPMYYSITGQGVVKGDFNHNNCVMNFVEVEVDLETGLAKITDCLSASDVGQIINPLELKMQFEGGLGSAGMDTGHLEELVLDPTIGRVMTHNMIDYKWRPFNELPKFDTAILESRWPTANPFGAIGIGEITGAAGPAAVMMAVENAIGGAEINQYPATPDRILNAMGKAKGGLGE